jgi:ABC-type cobalt transport system substrate-binding protein
MSKRNFILLIIVLIITIITFFVFLYFQQNKNTVGESGTGTNFISQFNPFSNITTKPVVTPPVVDISGYQPNPTTEITAKLKKVSSMPIAGFTVFSKERLKEVLATTPTTAPETKTTKTVKPTAPLTEFMPALRYVARTSGNIYQTFVDKIAEQKFTTTEIPKIYEAYFGNNGNSVIMRYLKTDDRTIETFVANLPKEYLGADTTVANEIKGVFLPENIKDLSLSTDSGSAFYLFNSGDNMIGTTLNLTTNKKVQIFDSPFTEWLSLWPNNKIVTLTTKPSSGVLGYMYALDPSTKSLNKIIGNINGLTTLTSPNGKLVLYGNDGLSLGVYHTDTKIADSLGVKTIPDKCVWNKTSDIVYCGVPKSISEMQYPDAWYQGVVSFSDQIWKIDIKTGNSTMLADPITISGGEDIDSIKLATDTNENYLFFVNKKDSYLWELQLN